MGNQGNYEGGRNDADQGRYGGGPEHYDERGHDQARNAYRARDDGGPERGEQSYGRPGQYANRSQQSGGGWDAGRDRDRDRQGRRADDGGYGDGPSGQRDYGEASSRREYGQGGYPIRPGGRDPGGWRGGPERGLGGAQQFGPQDFSPSAQRSQWREDQRYGDHGSTGDSYGAAGRSGQYGAGDHPSYDHEPHYRQWRDRQLASHDQDYARWRDEQARRYDEDYGQWRSQRHEAFSKDFHAWRSDPERHHTDAGTSPAVGDDSPTGSRGDPSGLSGAATGARGAQAGHSGPATGVSGAPGGATGSAGITGGSSDVAGYPGAGAMGDAAAAHNTKL
ncbi:MAG TPA: hypothetical protein VL460_01025 [Caulobacteraceae bacterium]|jgi:hypothetical protein|nr:hypothetical protein [Caulobacteraceae bacterium]